MSFYQTDRVGSVECKTRFFLRWIVIDENKIRQYLFEILIINIIFIPPFFRIYLASLSVPKINHIVHTYNLMLIQRIYRFIILTVISLLREGFFFHFFIKIIAEQFKVYLEAQSIVTRMIIVRLNVIIKTTLSISRRFLFSFSFFTHIMYIVR